jgi:ribosomal protein L30/L7E
MRPILYAGMSLKGVTNKYRILRAIRLSITGDVVIVFESDAIKGGVGLVIFA